MDLFEQIQQLIKELDISVKSLRKTGTEFAEAEKQYKMLLRQEALKLREKGEAVTLINQIVYGIPGVAELRFQRDVKEAVYNANQESINVIKLKLRILENCVNREWGNIK